MNTRLNWIVKTYQGRSDSREKTRPMVPAVEGMVIRMAAANPMAALFLENLSDLKSNTERCR